MLRDVRLNDGFEAEFVLAAEHLDGRAQPLPALARRLCITRRRIDAVPARRSHWSYLMTTQQLPDPPSAQTPAAEGDALPVVAQLSSDGLSISEAELRNAPAFIKKAWEQCSKVGLVEYADAQAIIERLTRERDAALNQASHERRLNAELLEQTVALGVEVDRLTAAIALSNVYAGKLLNSELAAIARGNQLQAELDEALSARDAAIHLANSRHAALKSQQPEADSRSQKMRDAGFTRRPSPFGCDECGRIFGGVAQLQAHDCTKPEADSLADAARYRWLAERFFGADFAWGSDDENPGCQMLLIQWPGGPVWGDLALTVDAAMKGTP
jgi:hypothetical protein